MRKDAGALCLVVAEMARATLTISQNCRDKLYENKRACHVGNNGPGPKRRSFTQRQLQPYRAGGLPFNWRPEQRTFMGKASDLVTVKCEIVHCCIKIKGKGLQKERREGKSRSDSRGQGVPRGMMKRRGNRSRKEWGQSV